MNLTTLNFYRYVFTIDRYTKCTVGMHQVYCDAGAQNVTTIFKSAGFACTRVYAHAVMKLVAVYAHTVITRVACTRTL